MPPVRASTSFAAREKKRHTQQRKKSKMWSLFRWVRCQNPRFLRRAWTKADQNEQRKKLRSQSSSSIAQQLRLQLLQRSTSAGSHPLIRFTASPESIIFHALAAHT